MNWEQAYALPFAQVQCQGPWSVRNWPRLKWIDHVLHTSAVGAGLSFGFEGRGLVTGQPVADATLFHLGPSGCLKFRGRKLVGREADQVTKTAMANYVAISDLEWVATVLNPSRC